MKSKHICYSLTQAKYRESNHKQPDSNLQESTTSTLFHQLKPAALHLLMKMMQMTTAHRNSRTLSDDASAMAAWSELLMLPENQYNILKLK